MTERIRRRDFGHMDIQLTIDDPKAYTKPWTAELHPRADSGHGSYGVRLQRERKRLTSPGWKVRVMDLPGRALRRVPSLALLEYTAIILLGVYAARLQRRRDAAGMQQGTVRSCVPATCEPRCFPWRTLSGTPIPGVSARLLWVFSTLSRKRLAVSRLAFSAR